MRLWVLATARRHNRSALPFIAVTSILVALIVTSCVVVARASGGQVVIETWDRQVKIATGARTVKDALAEANIVLGPGDSCVPPGDTEIKSGMKVTVNRAAPVFVAVDGQVRTVMTTSANVGDILAEANVALGADDIVVPGAEQEVPESGLVKVVRVTFGEVTEKEQVSYGTDRREDSSLEAGLTSVYRKGTPGIAEVTYAVRYEDGVEASREEKTRKNVSQPMNQVVLVGTLREVSRGGSQIRFERAVQVLSTAYCPCTICCGPNASGYTRSGLKAGKGVIAVDPRIIPLGTRVYVDGYGYAVAGDTGSAIKGSRIDVCFDTHQEALAWGMRNLKVYILE